MTRRWTKSEDESLCALVQKHGDRRGRNSKWHEISKGLPGRTNKDCRKRWFHSLDPSLRKGRWTADEDRALVTAYQRLGPAWKEIALLIPGRKDDQCAKRYNDVLHPSATNRLRKWTAEEDQLLQEKVGEMGHAWSAISVMFHGRPPLTCRNRWRKLSKSINSSTSTSSSSDSSSPGNVSESTSLPALPLEDESIFPFTDTGFDWESSVPDVNLDDLLNLPALEGLPADALQFGTPNSLDFSIPTEHIETETRETEPGIVYHIHHHHHYHFSSV